MTNIGKNILVQQAKQNNNKKNSNILFTTIHKQVDGRGTRRRHKLNN